MMSLMKAVNWFLDHAAKKRCKSRLDLQKDLQCSLIDRHEGDHVKVGKVLIDGAYENWCWTDVGEVHVDRVLPQNQIDPKLIAE